MHTKVTKREKYYLAILLYICFALYQQVFASELITISKAQVVEQIAGESPMASKEVKLPFYMSEKLYNYKTGTAHFTILFNSSENLVN